MDNVVFKPWLGKNCNSTKILILSESAYSWHDDHGNIQDPPPSHPKKALLWAIKKFPRRGYFTSMSRALCRRETPTLEQMMETWHGYAYTIYVQGTVGQGARKRPNAQQWKHASDRFLRLIEELRPLKVVVTGLDMWNHHMPDTSVQLDDHLQAYKLSDGTLVWCLALPHPSNSRQGFEWKRMGERIHLFKAAEFPRRK